MAVPVHNRFQALVNLHDQGMVRQVNKLAAFIKPSSPNQQTLAKQAKSSYAAAVTSKSPTGRALMGAKAHRDSGICRNTPGGSSDNSVRGNRVEEQSSSIPVDRPINHNLTTNSNTTGFVGGIQGREVQVEVHVGLTSPHRVVPPMSSPTNQLSPLLRETCLTPRKVGPVKSGGASFRLTPTIKKSKEIFNPQTQRPRENLAPPKVPALIIPGSQQDNQQGTVAMENGKETEPGTELILEPVKRDTLFYPTCHSRTERKINDWSIEITKPVVFIGDSNLARIPSFTDTNTQIDSFPGATFRHIAGVIGKLGKQENTQKVVLSVGLVNGLNQQYSTAVKQLQQLLNKTTEVFPHAQVYVPIIHFSDELSWEKQNVLNQLNQYIQKNCRELLDLNKLRFHTMQDDPIHWRPDTAVNILNYWLDQLNY
ncbi:uncharacterized protein LOC118372502 [Oncorhynchus keta]|uniref:uncharacterized protein LOC118372502 n=1 Tax=Oncorhynchus keta TaxID=8018 RepID=UPI00227CD809|nr:uncharacterized protein LOC118372502 [Oncorhynchus keta]